MVYADGDFALRDAYSWGRRRQCLSGGLSQCIDLDVREDRGRKHKEAWIGVLMACYPQKVDIEWDTMSKLPQEDP